MYNFWLLDISEQPAGRKINLDTVIYITCRNNPKLLLTLYFDSVKQIFFRSCKLLCIRKDDETNGHVISLFWIQINNLTKLWKKNWWYIFGTWLRDASVYIIPHCLMQNSPTLSSNTARATERYIIWDYVLCDLDKHFGQMNGFLSCYFRQSFVAKVFKRDITDPFNSTIDSR